MGNIVDLISLKAKTTHSIYRKNPKNKIKKNNKIGRKKTF
jgi:hypothetical protein